MIKRRLKLDRPKRKRLTERQVLRVLVNQGALIPCRQCGLPFRRDEISTVEREHTLALALGGEDEIENMQFSHRECHREQTRRDKAQIAKADRQKLKHETGRSSAKKHVKKIESRGFDKTLRKKFDGTVERVS